MNAKDFEDHDDESPEEKARWFQTLTVEERLEWLCYEAERLLKIDSTLRDRNLPEPIPGRIQILRLPEDQ